MSRLPSALSVSALLRGCEAAGGSAALLARGDRDSGTILVIGYDRGEGPLVFERARLDDGSEGLVRAGPQDGGEQAVRDYWLRRRTFDPDLWVVELRVAGVERFTAETLRSH